MCHNDLYNQCNETHVQYNVYLNLHVIVYRCMWLLNTQKNTVKTV